MIDNKDNFLDELLSIHQKHNTFIFNTKECIKNNQFDKFLFLFEEKDKETDINDKQVKAQNNIYKINYLIENMYEEELKEKIDSFYQFLQDVKFINPQNLLLCSYFKQSSHLVEKLWENSIFIDEKYYDLFKEFIVNKLNINYEEKQKISSIEYKEDFFNKQKIYQLNNKLIEELSNKPVNTKYKL